MKTIYKTGHSAEPSESHASWIGEVERSYTVRVDSDAFEPNGDDSHDNDNSTLSYCDDYPAEKPLRF